MTKTATKPRWWDEATDQLKEDVEYLITCAEESDLVRTLDEAFQMICEDCDDKQHWSHDHKAFCRKVMIRSGVYRPMTQDEIDNTYTFGGRNRKPWEFKIKGVAYIFDEWKELD